MGVLRRLAILPVTALLVATVVFFVLRVVPGDASDVLASQATDPDQRAQITQELGLDEPLWRQYLLFLSGMARLDLGISFYSGQPVVELLFETVPVTIELAVASVLVMVGVGVSTGMIAAAFRNTWLDAAARFVAVVLFSMPWFWLGILLIVVFGVYLGWLPTFGRLPATVTYDPTTNFILVDALIQGRPDLILPWLQHLILPAVTVGLTTAGFVTQITRTSFIETMFEDFVRTARMKGMSEFRVFWGHIFRNAALPIVTIVGLQFGALLGGAVVSEAVFSYPGVGRMMVNAIFQRDYPVVQGAALVIASLYILVNTLTDISYLYLDPRLRRS
nr:ABC transporter permease [Rubrobacter xylanophilus]